MAALPQGCVLPLIIFNLLLVAITLVSHRYLQSSDCVGIEYRLDGGLFNLRRLLAKSRTSSAAFPSLTADRLQRSLDIMSETYLYAGLIINTMKTEILSASSHDAQTFSISGNQLKNSIQTHIDLASSAFGRLSKRVLGSHNLMIHSKIAVYDAVVISTIWL